MRGIKNINWTAVASTRELGHVHISNTIQDASAACIPTDERASFHKRIDKQAGGRIDAVGVLRL